MYRGEIMLSMILYGKKKINELKLEVERLQYENEYHTVRERFYQNRISSLEFKVDVYKQYEDKPIYSTEDVHSLAKKVEYLTAQSNTLKATLKSQEEYYNGIIGIMATEE